MKRYGRRAGFTLGALAGMLGAAVCTAAVAIAQLLAVLPGHADRRRLHRLRRLLPLRRGRRLERRFKSRAISLVLAGGIIGGILGPESSKLTKDLFVRHVHGLLRGAHGVRAGRAAHHAAS